ncbi:MAG: adenylosuccinate lyase family protein [Alphaproteobacteria bacterium]|nr:adenylosuccinate lyase family protein [Alphaproteobacteria bacterium]MCB9928786.1 adenylosuccinate lyase family protein [Alphaproteobacteria bacterium]
MSDATAHSPTAARLPEAGIRALFTTEARWQAWMDVEAALARAQAAIGMIPADVAPVIAAKADLTLFDRERVAEGFRRTGHTIVPLVWELARLCGEPAGGYVHWGATTENIVRTGDTLQLRKAHAIFLRLIDDTLAAMAAIAERSADMVMAGRTHGQHAVPITFGLKVAGWIDGLMRSKERLVESEKRVFVGMLGGAAGSLASFGDQGLALQAKMSELLGLTPMTVPSRALVDYQAEYIAHLGLLAAVGGMIGRECYQLMRTEYGEAREPVPPGTVGSSTMPQKRNPILAQDIIAYASQVRATVPLALEAAQIEHEADRTNSVMMRDAMNRACIATGDILVRLREIMRGLDLDPARMRANLNLGGGLIMAEALMLDLARHIGRQEAHDVIYDAAEAAISGGQSFDAALAADPRVTGHLTPEQIAAMLDPAAYTGLSGELARQAARRVRGG